MKNITIQNSQLSRKFINAGLFVTVLLFLITSLTINELNAQPCESLSTIGSNFNGTAIAGNRYIWFSSHFKIKNRSTDPSYILLTNSSVAFSVGATNYNLLVPNSLVTFTSSVATPSVTFNNALQRWEVNVPLTYTGDVFLSGLAYQVPAAGLPGGINPVSWTGNFSTNDPTATVNWQWGAAVYTNFTTNYNALGVLPVAGTYQEGTPVNFRTYVIGGARGGGGSNYTGSNSGTGQVDPCDGGGVIPVELVSFNAKAITPEIVQLSWTTASEVNNDYIAIEKTSDLNNWEHVCIVHGKGTSTEMNHYSCTDSAANKEGKNTVYYRPKQVDFNGTYEYFNIIKLRLENSNTAVNEVENVYPNPATDRIKIQYNAAENGVVKIRLMSIEGKAILVSNYNTKQGQQIVYVDIPENNLATGLYVLEVESEGMVYRQKVYKQ